MDEDKITKQVFHMDYQKSSNNWSSEIKYIMETIGCICNKTVINLTQTNRKIKDY